MTTQQKINLYTRYISTINQHEQEFNNGRQIYRPFPSDSFSAILRKVAQRKLAQL